MIAITALTVTVFTGTDSATTAELKVFSSGSPRWAILARGGSTR
jgi:hypothetical protein